MATMQKLLLILSAFVLLAGCAGGRSAFSKGERLEQEGKLDEAVVKYAEAASANPESSEYRVRFLTASAEAARRHIKQGNVYLDGKKYDDAIREYQTAIALDPSQEIAAQQSAIALKLRNSKLLYQEGVEFEKGNKLREAFRAFKKAEILNPEDQRVRDAIERILKSRKTKLEGFELNLKSTKPITLKFKDAKLKEVFAILSQLSGINFIFDEAVKDHNFSIYLENATFQQALDILTNVNKLGRKVLNESTIIIYPKTPDKIKQYEELMVQTFYLNKLDAKKAVNLLRTMLQIKKIYVNEEMNAIVIRDTPDVIDVARKIIEANDIPDAEVLLDVEVVEISKSKADSFGLLLSKYAVTMNTLAPDGVNFLSDSFTPQGQTITTTGTTTTQAASTAGNLLNVMNWRGFGGFITVPNATFNLGKSLANGDTLSNPKILVKNREKAKFNVGTRVPITTTSSPTGGGVSVNVQYVDVGVKVNAEPTIQLNNEVSIKLSLEVSSILSRDKIGDASSLTTVVTIGTRNLDTVLDLKDGETSVIGGLIQDQKSNSKKKVFLLGDIPVIGDLFTSHDDSNDKTELVLAITPHIVRGVAIPPPDVTSFWSGREDEPSAAKIYSSFSQDDEELLGASQPRPVTPTKAVTRPPVTGQTVQPGAKEKEPAGKQPAVTQPVAVPPARVSLSIAAPSSAKLNDQFTVDVKAAGAKDLKSAPFVLVYDPLFVDFVGAAEGPFLRSDGKPTQFGYSVDRNTGQVTVTLDRTGETGGLSGDGTLMTATFKAKNQGPANLGFKGAHFAAPKGTPIEVLPYSTVVEIK